MHRFRSLAITLPIVVLGAALIPLVATGGDDPGGDAGDTRDTANTAEKAASAHPFGFRGQEIYKLDRGAFGLRETDLNGDGLRDLVLINNTKARIDFYLRRTEPAAGAGDEEDRKANDLPEGRWFERVERLTEKQVASMALGDFDGDGRQDLAYYGKPLELIVAYGDGRGGFDRERTLAADDGLFYRYALAAGDLNADGRLDIVLLAKDHVKWWAQAADGTLGEPELIPHAASEPAGVSLADLDGNGREDLVIFAPNEARSVRVRFQSETGVLGPETAFKLPPIRGLGFYDLDPRPGDEIVVVQQTSGLLRALDLVRVPAGEGSGIPLASVRIHPYAARTGDRRLALGDVNGDGRTDVVTTAPKTAQVVLQLQDAGRLGPPRFFPSLAEPDVLEVADVTGDGKDELVVLSRKEKSVAWSGLDREGRLPFPAALPVDGDPRALDVADLDGDGRPEVVVVSKDEGWLVTWFAPDEAGEGLAAAGTLRLEEIGDSSEPEELLVTDLDGDGRAELIVIDRFKTFVWRQDAEGAFTYVSGEETFNLGLIARKKRSELHVVDLDGDGRTRLAVASANFARVVGIDGEGRLQVLDQINARSASSRIEGLVATDLDGDGTREVAVLDGDGERVTVLRLGETGVYEVAASFEVGGFRFQRLEAADVNGDGREDLVVVGAEKFGVLAAGGDDLELRELASFESPIRDAWLASFDAGDLNGDGYVDLVVAEGANHMLEIVAYRGDEGFAHRLKWRVFEQKGHGGERASRGEPRELVVADFDGDGGDDVAILVHDRLIVYPQD